MLQLDALIAPVAEQAKATQCVLPYRSVETDTDVIHRFNITDSNPPPIDPTLKHQRLLYGWKVDEFIQKHGSVADDDVLCVIFNLSLEIGLQDYVHFFGDFIWLSRNYISWRNGQVYDKGLSAIPDEKNVQRLVTKLGLGEPKWLLLEPRSACPAELVAPTTTGTDS